jgi:hypothetical protein
MQAHGLVCTARGVMWTMVSERGEARKRQASKHRIGSPAKDVALTLHEPSSLVRFCYYKNGPNIHVCLHHDPARVLARNRDAVAVATPTIDIGHLDNNSHCRGVSLVSSCWNDERFVLGDHGSRPRLPLRQQVPTGKDMTRHGQPARFHAMFFCFFLPPLPSQVFFLRVFPVAYVSRLAD